MWKYVISAAGGGCQTDWLRGGHQCVHVSRWFTRVFAGLCVYMCHVGLPVYVEVCVYTHVMLAYMCLCRFVCVHVSCWLTGFTGGLCVYMCHVGLQVSAKVCVGICVMLVYWSLWRFVCVHVSCWFTGVCGGLCMYMC